VLVRWAQRKGVERQRSRTEQSFCVPKADIAANGYDLSINRYKEVVHAVVTHRAPLEILAKLAKLEDGMVCKLGYKHLGQQTCSGDGLADDVRVQRSLGQGFALGAGPCATDMAL
jgi:hypothetical protein